MSEPNPGYGESIGSPPSSESAFIGNGYFQLSPDGVLSQSKIQTVNQSTVTLYVPYDNTLYSVQGTPRAIGIAGAVVVNQSSFTGRHYNGFGQFVTASVQFNAIGKLTASA